MLRTYEHTTEFVPVTEPARLPGSYKEALKSAKPEATSFLQLCKDDVILAGSAPFVFPAQETTTTVPFKK